MVVTPERPGPAFTYGLSLWLLAMGEGDSLVPSGETLTSLGVSYRKVNTGRQR